MRVLIILISQAEMKQFVCSTAPGSVDGRVRGGCCGGRRRGPSRAFLCHPKEILGNVAVEEFSVLINIQRSSNVLREIELTALAGFNGKQIFQVSNQCVDELVSLAMVAGHLLPPEKALRPEPCLA